MEAKTPANQQDDLAVRTSVDDKTETVSGETVSGVADETAAAVAVEPESLAAPPATDKAAEAAGSGNAGAAVQTAKDSWKEKIAAAVSVLNRFRPVAVFSGVYLVLCALLRLSLWVGFGLPEGVRPDVLPMVFGFGLLNDLLVAGCLAFPLSIYLYLMPQRLYQSKVHRWLAGTVTYYLVMGLLFLQAAEYFFFAKFSARFNLIAVDYLLKPAEQTVAIWNSMQVIWILLIIAAVSGGLLKLLWPVFTKNMDVPTHYPGRSKILLLHLLLAVAAGLIIVNGGFSVSGDRLTAELSANGFTNMVRAVGANDIPWDLYYRTIDKNQAYAVVRQNLAGGNFNGSQEDLSREFPVIPNGFGKMNIVIVVEESFDKGSIGVYGNSSGHTPNFDRLAQEGLLFTRAYATGTSTVRALEAITLSLPPIPSEAVIKRQGSENMASWGSVMAAHGYHRSFIFGGYSFIDNLRHFYANNGFAVSDRRDIPDQTFSNLWGVCDEDLFNYALNYYDKLAKNSQPFFSIVVTASNHPPYTFPGGQGSGGAGIRYADYALGEFIAKARRHAWFDNTLFVIVANHSEKVAGQTDIPLKSYEIPLLFYAPAKIPAQTKDVVASQIDIAPTVLAMLGLPYQAPFYGHNLLTEGEKPRPILLSHNYRAAILQGDTITIVGLLKEVDGSRFDRAVGQHTPISPDSEMVELTTAYYQTAYDLYLNCRYK